MIPALRFSSALGFAVSLSFAAFLLALSTAAIFPGLRISEHPVFIGAFCSLASFLVALLIWPAVSRIGKSKVWGVLAGLLSALFAFPATSALMVFYWVVWGDLGQSPDFNAFAFTVQLSLILLLYAGIPGLLIGAVLGFFAKRAK